MAKPKISKKKSLYKGFMLPDDIVSFGAQVVVKSSTLSQLSVIEEDEFVRFELSTIDSGKFIFSILKSLLS